MSAKPYKGFVDFFNFVTDILNIRLVMEITDQLLIKYSMFKSMKEVSIE